MTGNISKANGLRGYRGYKGERGEPGIPGEKGDTVNVSFSYDKETGNLYCETEYVPSLTTAPYIGENGNWYVFDGKLKKFVDSGVSASGGGGGGSGIPTQYIDEYIDNKTAIMKADIEGIRQQMNNESHFRGYFLFNDHLLYVKATPNDFAYSAESGTQWVYTGEKWVDIDIPVPDQLTPPSETTPSPNGVASAGEENAYARGDHIHPTDITRASVDWVSSLDELLGSTMERVENLEIQVDDFANAIDTAIALCDSYINGGAV